MYFNFIDPTNQNPTVIKLIIHRLLQAIPLLIAISLVTFFLLFHSPGDFLASLAFDPKISKEFLEAERARLGLDQPWYIVWFHWITGVITAGDFGHSFSYRMPVASLIGARLYNTFLLALCSSVIAWFIGVPFGMIAAMKQDKWPDRIASAIAFLGLSIPAVLLALFAVYFAAITGWFPTGGMTDPHHYAMTGVWQKMLDIIHHLIMPSIVLGVGGLAIYTRQMRSNLLETLRSDYMRTAMAKGLSYGSAVRGHALRNAINPMITLFGFAFSELLSGAFLVENVMDWPGLGRTTIEAYTSKDMFVVATSVLLAAAMLIIGNLIADILLGINDPRIRQNGA